MRARAALLLAALCVLAPAVALAFNWLAVGWGPAALLPAAVLTLLATVAITARAAPAAPDPFFYGFCLFAFTSVIDLLIPLEFDGFISGFMGAYIRDGEPYLFSAWGALAAYWDGTFNLVCYLYMAHCAWTGRGYRTLALYYAANILNSMAVLLVAAAICRVGLQPCSLLNIPYVLLPAVLAARELARPPALELGRARPRPRHPLLAALLLLYAAAAVLRGLAALGSPSAAAVWLRERADPLLQQTEPAPFAAAQALVSLFHLAPAAAVLAAALLKGANGRWAADLAVLLAGASLQAEVCLLGMQLHPLTAAQHRGPPPGVSPEFAVHCTAHVLTLLAPQLAAAALSRGLHHPQQPSARKRK